MAVDPKTGSREQDQPPPGRQYPDPKRTLDKNKHGTVPTTGHTWDGIEEFDNPMPRWWLWTFYACILWALVYTVFYPAWPMLSSATPGVLGSSTRADVAAEIERFNAANAPIRDRLVATDVAAIPADAELNQYATNAGAAVFMTWCAQCHGSGAAGVQSLGYPNLLDDDWLWGGDMEAVYTTVQHGIRNTTDTDARYSEMPRFGADELLEPTQIAAVVQHVLAISGQPHEATLAAEGATVFADNCVACHAEDGTGDRAQGAPDLTDAIWLYGGDAASLTETVSNARFGVMPAWAGRLSDADIRSVAVYVHGLGGANSRPAKTVRLDPQIRPDTTGPASGGMPPVPWQGQIGSFAEGEAAWSGR